MAAFGMSNTLRCVINALVIAAVAGAPLYAAESNASTARTKGKQAAAKQKRYAEPEEGVKELLAEVKGGDMKALAGILGPGSSALISSGDAVADREERDRFVKSYEEANKIEREGDARAVLTVGGHGWPFPIPMVKDGDGWRFDARAGQEEVLNRRVGHNELSVMQAVLAYVDAQLEYYLANPPNDRLLTFAQKLVSSKGKRDGLYFPTKEGEPESPLGPLFEATKAEGYRAGEGGKPVPYFGYYYRILKAQGPDAPGGAYSYMAGNKMIGGHGLIAWPATWGNSGVMTFLVNHEGKVYEKDLGPHTDAEARKIAKFNPDESWKRIETK